METDAQPEGTALSANAQLETLYGVVDTDLKALRDAMAPYSHQLAPVQRRHREQRFSDYQWFVDYLANALISVRFASQFAQDGVPALENMQHGFDKLEGRAVEFNALRDSLEQQRNAGTIPSEVSAALTRSIDRLETHTQALKDFLKAQLETLNPPEGKPMSTQAPDTKALETNVEQIGNLYRQLLPIMQAIHAKYPELKREYMQRMDESDGFCRMIDLVPNIQHRLMMELDMPEIEPATALMTKAAQTSEIFAQSRALLEEAGKRDPQVRTSQALTINDLLEDTLLQAYEGFDALRTPATPPTAHGVSAVKSDRLQVKSAGREPGEN